MRNSLRWLSLFMAPALVISLSALMVACGGGDDEGGGDDATAVLNVVNPADGSTVPENSTVTLTFDKDPGAVTVNGAAAAGAGTSRTFTVTAAANSIAWDNGGAQTVNYTLTAPDTTPATLSSVSPDVKDATDVDPADLADGIELTFSEDVDVDELLISTGGSALAWINTTDGAVVTMQDAGDDPIVNETTYDVEGTVVDLGGNETDVSFPFTTKAKE
jgi:hypothetical protein